MGKSERRVAEPSARYGAAFDRLFARGRDAVLAGWFEADFTRDIWYATLVHFTGALRDPAALVDWVAARRDVHLADAVVDAAELLRFRFNGRQPVRVPLARAPFGTATGTGTGTGTG